MIAHYHDLRIFLQGGPHPVLGNRSKCYQGYFCLQLALGAPVELSFGSRRSVHRRPVCWVSYSGPVIASRMVDPSRPWIHRYVSFIGTLAQTWWEAGLMPREPVELEDGAQLAQRFDALLEIEENHGLSHARKVNALEEIFLNLSLNSEKKWSGPLWLQKAQELLSDHHRGTPVIAEVAEACSMAQSTFRRQFAKATGLSPQDWLLKERMKRARSWLRDRSLSISDVADRVGYPDVFLFSKQFKQRTGVTPSAWRMEL